MSALSHEAGRVRTVLSIGLGELMFLFICLLVLAGGVAAVVLLVRSLTRARPPPKN